MSGTEHQPRPFPAQSGVVLVCGNGWTLPDDMGRARSFYPDAPVLAVNGASAAVVAQMLFTLHPRQMAGWRAAQAKINPVPVTTHGATSRHNKTKLGKDDGRNRDIDYWWDGALSRGSSGWSACKAAKLMGFDEIIMCGIPLSEGDYHCRNGSFPKAWRTKDTINHYRKGVLADADWHDGVYSMSGFTREVLGAPDVNTSVK